MKSDLGITCELFPALQQKDQDIVNAMKLVELSKQHLQPMRYNEWNSLFEEVYVFCAKNNIVDFNIDDPCQPQSRRKAQRIKNSHNFFVNYTNLYATPKT